MTTKTDATPVAAPPRALVPLTVFEDGMRRRLAPFRLAGNRCWTDGAWLAWVAEPGPDEAPDPYWDYGDFPARAMAVETDEAVLRPISVDRTKVKPCRQCGGAGVIPPGTKCHAEDCANGRCRCSTCHGSGRCTSCDCGSDHDCGRCEGSGTIGCDWCDGKGTIPVWRCGDCDGTGLADTTVVACGMLRISARRAGVLAKLGAVGRPATVVGKDVLWFAATVDGVAVRGVLMPMVKRDDEE